MKNRVANLSAPTITPQLQQNFRPHTAPSKLMELPHIKTVLLDIEGTVCPISFVKETLFPYALKALPDVLHKKWDDPEFAPYRDAFPPEAQQSPSAFEAHVKDLTQRDVKVAYLKNLQGYLWRTGYESGAFSTPLFTDVTPQLKAWHEAGKQLAIFSSGSVDAQKLLFHYVGEEGGEGRTEDLNYLFAGYFDTLNAGPKTESQSYAEIARQLGRECGEVLFLSDNVREVQAALGAGMHAIIVDRPGNAPLSDAERRFPMVSSLQELKLV